MIGEKLKQLDPLLIGCVIGLFLCGMTALYSISQSLLQSGTESAYWLSQLTWFSLGLLSMLIVAFMPNRTILETSYMIYIISIVSLILVLFFGIKGYGASRWLRIGTIVFQPSEIAKIAVILAVGRFLSEESRNINQLGTLLVVSAIIILPFILIAKQPDLGTSLVFVVLILPVFYWAGLKARNLLLILAPVLVLFASFNYYTFFVAMIFVAFLIKFMRGNLLKVLYAVLNIAIGLLTPFLWNQLKSYQRQRILTFWNPESDPLGAGYQIIQSKVAIGSGGFTGKGFLNGSQTQLRFLPEQHTDFIFAVIGEEWGFLGVMFVLLLFLFLLCRIVHISGLFRSRFHSIVSIGIGTVIAFHMFVNIGMSVGLFPVTGLPLPFISYGGTALLSNMIMIGLLLNFYRHRFEY